jgi:hypothetical protein
MKIFLSLILLFTFTVYSQDSRTISIDKNNQNEFEIISNGKTIYKFNKDNCDSSTLAILDDIYYESTKEGNLSTGINIINLPPTESADYTGVFITLIVVFFSYLTARFLYNRQVRAENKRAWLEKVRIEGARMLYISDFLISVSDRNNEIKQRLETIKKSTIEENTEVKLLTQKTVLENLMKDQLEIEKHTKELENEFRECFHRFRFLFNTNTHVSFLKSWITFSASYKEEQKIAKEKFIEFSEAMADLINKEQDNLDKGKF